MRTLLFGATLVTAFLLPASQAAAQCCGGHATQATQAAPADHAAHAAPATPKAGCCADHAMPMAAASTPMACCDHPTPGDDSAVAMAGLGLEAAPAVKYIDIVFRDPVKVGDTILLGAYLIEHDDERMARGEPCTYIYEADDRRAPVAMFHCEHLERPVAGSATVVLAPTMNSAIKRLVEFQFRGETASHGVPVR